MIATDPYIFTVDGDVLGPSHVRRVAVEPGTTLGKYVVRAYMGHDIYHDGDEYYYLTGDVSREEAKAVQRRVAVIIYGWRSP